MSKSFKHRVVAVAVALLLVAGISWTSLAAGGDGEGTGTPSSGNASAAVGSTQSPEKGQAVAVSRRLPKRCTPPLGCGEDLEAALDFEAKILDNFWFGQLFEINYATSERIQGNVAKVHTFGDSALWTGTYLAAESFRYALANKYLSGKGLNREERTFWADQKSEARQRAEAMVAKFHILTNISEDWNHEMDLTQQKQPGFGGGVFHGEKGYLMRACVPAEAKSWQTWDNLKPDPDGDGDFTGNRRVFGPLDWTNADGTVTQYFCEDGTSRDAYAGTTFGLLTAFDLVFQEESELRNQIGDDIVTLVDFAVRNHWTTPRPHGRVSVPVPVPNPPCSICGHEFDNFTSPLFVQVPMARLNMAKAAQHVAHTSPERYDVERWDAVYSDEVDSQVPILAGSMAFDAIQPNEAYFKFNLHHLTGFNITRLEEDPSINASYMEAMGVMDHTTGDDINAHFETITFALTGETDRFEDAIQHLREWRSYRARIDVGGDPKNSLNCGTSLDCVPQEQLGVTQSPADDTTVPIPPIDCKTWLDAAAVVNTPGKIVNARCRASSPLPVPLRPPTDFLWQRPPTQLDGEKSAVHQSPGVDYLLPYWMLRYYSEVEKPVVSSFPSWAGPAHS